MNHSASSHQFHPTLLREYDVRGVIDKTLSTLDAYALGRSFATLVHQANAGLHVVVARDGRLSSPSLMDALVEGLLQSGINVTDLGLGPTPMLYYGVHALKAAGGIMITGSHNPPCPSLRRTCHERYRETG